MVGSFETVASSLVSRENFAGFELVQDQITVSAAIVSNTIMLLLYRCTYNLVV